MKKYFIFSLSLFLSIAGLTAQNKQPSNFRIDGTIKADSGKISLQFYSDYLPNKTKELVAQIKDKKFSISGYIPESQGVFLAFGNRPTPDFVIEKGVQTISVNIDSFQTVPKVNNKTMLEEYPKKDLFYQKINAKRNFLFQKYDSLLKQYNYQLPKEISNIVNKEKEAMYRESDSTLLAYTKMNPDSKTAFWNLISLMSWGYEPIFDSIYSSFSNTLRGGYAGKVLGERLKIGKLLSVGQPFPIINCQNKNNEKLSSALFLRNKYTLVDFWYSACSPCRRQFPNLQNLYKQYGNNGFEIVGISIDKIANKPDWERVIADNKLVWKQYWDKNGTETHRLSIFAFPTNFLIDNTGKIVSKNISMEELEEFLKGRLK
jgi:thiol-disulfide isomerase/thioredoxin